jgi:hypothetical protein
MKTATDTPAPAAAARSGTAPALCVAIMCHGTTFPRWQAEAITQLLAVPGVAPLLLIVEPPPDPERAPRSAGGAPRGPTLLWRVYQRLRIRGRLECDRPTDLSARLAGVRAITCTPELRGRYSQHFREPDLAAIRAAAPDLILRFAYNILRGDILTTPRLGVWSFHHGDLERYRGQPACFWEVRRGDPVTGVTLQRLTDALDAGIVLRRAWTRTMLKSFPRSRSAALLSTADLPALACRDFLAGDTSRVESPPSSTAAPIDRTPTNRHMAGFLIRQTRAAAADAWTNLFRHDQWNVGLVDAPIHRFLDPAFRPAVRWLPRPARGQIQADPFGVARDGGVTVLYEDLHDRENLGRIHAAEFPDNAPPRLLGPVIDTGSHLSYPYLVEHEGETYCIPESAASGRVDLYRAVKFPGRWDRVATLLDEPLIDASIFRHAGLWWLLGARKRGQTAVALHAWWSHHLDRGWTPHRLNPISIDIRSSRPGGTPFVHEGVLYRPAQDLSRTYGGRIDIRRVERLTPDEFEESSAAIVEPRRDWPYRHGLHTLSAVGERTLIDAKRLVFSPAQFSRQVFGRFSRPRAEIIPAAAGAGALAPVRAGQAVEPTPDQSRSTTH